jgi:hypothetical protein
MEPHQQRVVEEQKELETKTVALHKFILESPIFGKLASEEQERLKRQYSVMVEYNEILNERIAAF